MAEVKEERIYTIPLRKAYDTERSRRAKRAVTEVRTFLTRHMKSEDVKIGNSINKTIWSRGIQKPPHKVRVHAISRDGAVYAELVGVDIKLPSAELLKKKAEKIKEKAQKIKEERKARRKETIQEEIKREQGAPETVEDRIADVETAEMRNESKDEKAAESRKLPAK